MENSARRSTIHITFDSRHLTDASEQNCENVLHQGFRCAAFQHVRQFILRDEEFDIHIKVQGAGEGRQIHGQLLSRRSNQFAPPAQCHLLSNGERYQSTSTDETGEFHFDGVPEGELYLQVDLPHLTIVGSMNQDDTP